MRIIYYHILLLVIIMSALISCESTRVDRKMMLKANRYYNQGLYDRAEKLYDKMIMIDSLNGEAYYNRAYCLANRNALDCSNYDYFKCIELGYNLEQSYFNLGCNFAIIGLDSIAIDYFHKAYELNPQNIEAEIQIKILNQ